MRWAKPWITSLSKLFFGAYLILTSLYCLLAFIPYTYSFLIKEPPSEALIAFVRYHSVLFWFNFALGLLAYWERRKRRLTQIAWAVLALIGMIFSAENFLPHIQNNWTSYVFGTVMLLPLLLLAGGEASGNVPVEAAHNRASLLCYSNGVLVALIVSAVTAEAILIRNYCEDTASGLWSGLLHAGIRLDLRTLQLSALVLATNLWLTVLLLSVVNLILMGATRITRRPRFTRLLVLGGLVFLGVFLSSFRFLLSMLNLQQWPALAYAIVFAAALTLWGLTLPRPFLNQGHSSHFSQKTLLWVMLVGLSGMALVLPSALGDTDWNGVVQNSFTLLLWIAVSVSVYRLRPRDRKYSLYGILAVLIVAGSVFWGITQSAFLWAKKLGSTDGEIGRSMESYATQNSSFNMVYHWRASARIEPCEDFCLILRQYTNVRDTEMTREVQLVERLTPARGARPNILIITVDSLGADYVGAYNPKVDFTPNLDEFARDSVVLHNAFTPYAGTTLAEPSIWTGMLLLHAHYVHPFDNVNMLERLLKADDYRMILSYDSVLRRTLTNTDDAIKLDLGKPWNHFEASSTFQQLEAVLDKRQPQERPFFFYAQPMNVHEFGVNDRPKRTSANWTTRPGFNNRRAFAAHQVDESCGDLFHYLKSHDLYENSIIIVTADHGDGSEQIGHLSHSTVIYPEVMQVPLIIHLPGQLKKTLAYDEDSLASLIDITPSLYMLLGHGPVQKNPLFGRPLFAKTREELQSYPRNDLLLASDARAAYGLVSGDDRFMYVTYDSPAQSYLYDLTKKPDATQGILTNDVKQRYDRRLIEYLQTIAEFYGYKPSGNRNQKLTW
ncbi:MAG TPA: sulfatase-like hydrolase/transferase [Candidatus Angelobacter sp.]